MKNIFSIIFFVFLFLSFSFAAIPAHTDYYVNDFAEVFSQGQIDELTSLLYNLTQDTTAEVVVVTVNSLEGTAPIDYATEIGQTWGVGKKDTDNGLVILYAKAENKIAVATGYGLEGILPDSKVGRILDEQYVPQRDVNNVSVGIINATKVYVDELYKNKEEIGLIPQQTTSNFEWMVIAIVLIIILIVAGLFLIFVVKTKQKGGVIRFIFGGILLIISFFFSEPLSVILFFFGVILIMSTSGGSGFSGGFSGGHSGGGFSGGGSFGGGSFGGGGASR